MAAFLPLLADKAGAGKETAFKRIAMQYIFGELINRGAHVAFVQIPVKSSDGIKTREKIAQLEAIPEKDRTDSERSSLNILSQGLKDGTIPATSNVSFKEATYDVTLPARLDDPEVEHRVLQKVVALDPRYELLLYGSLYVICSKNDPIKTERATLVLKDLPADEAISRLEKVMEQHKIDHVEIYSGPTSHGPRYGNIRVSLNLVDVPLIELLSSFVAQMDPGMTWDMMTIEGEGRHFGFTNISSPSHN